VGETFQAIARKIMAARANKDKGGLVKIWGGLK
jgi:hypothetical protein